MHKWKGSSGQELGHSVVDKIGNLDLSVSPQNYEVWLNYISGESPDLKAAVDDSLSSNASNDEAFERIHERFFSSNQLSNQVMETGSKIAQEITDALEALVEAGASTERYSATLESAAQTLGDQELSASSIQRIVSVLTSATQEMSEQNSTLNQRLKQSSEEIDNLRQYLREARAEALTDGLTGVANRKYFDETIRMRIAEAREEGADLCLVMGDIDHFKTFNDRWGHQTGDQVIRFVASSMTAHTLPDHLVARYGGEEFAIIMPRTSLERAQKVANNVRSAIQAKKLMRRSTNEPLGQITISFGISMLTASDTTQSFIERADSCLYQSKKNGRNKVTTEAETQNQSAA